MTVRLVPAIAALVYALVAEEVAGQAVTVAPANPNITVGQTVQLTVTGIDVPTATDAGGFHNCALLEDDTVRCWGENDFGALGNGTTTASSTPVPVTGLTGVAAISSGGFHTCARFPNNTLQCWGLNSGEANNQFRGGGQLGNGDPDLGLSLTPVPVIGITAATAVTAGGFHTCALQDGTVSCWGLNNYGQLGRGNFDADPGPPAPPPPRRSTPVTVTGITTAIAISAGGWHTCALLANGTVFCWGQNTFGQIGNGETVTPFPQPPAQPPARRVISPVRVVGINNAVAIKASAFNTCARLATGTMQCWGWNDFAQLGAVDPRNASSTPVTVQGITPATLANGGEHTCVAFQNGRVQCWGDNTWGQNGNGSAAGIYALPTAVVRDDITGDVITATTATSGAEHSCALLLGGTVQCWGVNQGGRLGVPTTDRRIQSCPSQNRPPLPCAFTAVTVVGLGVTWTSDNPTVATVTATGFVEARNAGTTMIRAASGARSGSANLTVRSATPGDTTPPVRSNGQPTGTQPAGTTQVTLSLATNEAATCRFATTPGTAYGATTGQPLASSGGGTVHSATFGNLVNGGNYTVFVRCQDAALNVNTDDFTIAFSVASPSGDTVPPVRSNGRPTGAQPAGTTEVTMHFSTNEPATCRYATTPGTAYSTMTGTLTPAGGGTFHVTTIGGLNDGRSYTFYARCQDTAGNFNTNDFTIAFSVGGGSPSAESTPPVRSNGQPTGTQPAGTTQVTLSLATNEAATCRFATTPGAAYSAMTGALASSGGGTVHSATFGGLANGGNYTIYARCQDTTGNFNTDDFTIAFSVASPTPGGDTTPPVRSSGRPTGTQPAGTREVTLSFSTNEPATCRYAMSPGIAYSAMTGTMTRAGSGNFHIATIGGLVDGGSYAVRARCQDTAGNVNTEDFTIAFSVAAQ